MKYSGLYEVVEWLETNLMEVGCKVVSFGEATEYDEDKEILTPGCHITPISTSISGMTQVYTMELFAYQVKEHFKFDISQSKENVIDALDEAALILQRISTRLAERRINIGGGTYATISNTGEFGAALMEGNAGLMGWIGSITVTITGYVGRC